MSARRIASVLAVDDHPLPLEITCALLAKVFAGAEIRSATGLEEALRHARRAGAPDLALLDLGLPGCAGIEALERFRQSCPRTMVVIYSACEEPVTVRAALRAGARGYIPKSTPKDQVRSALRHVAAGGTYVPAEALAQTDAGKPELSVRERDVLRLIVRGYSNKRIAREIGVSVNTVKHLASAVYRALGVVSRAEAIVAARQRGIFPD
ncbi:MAG: response regulator transcription factor [Pseudomonadota bacterium]